jgi:hypothetical protein
MPWVAAAAAAMNMAGGIIGGQSQRDAATQAGDAQKKAMLAYIDKLDKVGMPPDQSALLILDQYQQAGILTPQLEQQLQDTVNEFKNIKTNEAARNQQIQVLRQMAQYGRAGLTPDEAAEMRKARQGVQQDLEAKQQQIIQNLAARGQAGSGAEIAARLGASQAAADRASEESDRVSSLAQQRALQALIQQSGMANQLRGQDFSEDSARAEAQNVMNRFDRQNQIGIGQRNVHSQNLAQESNLQNLQRIKDSNVEQSNKEKYNQLQRQRQNWLDKLDYARAYQAPLTDYGDAAARQASGEQQAVGKMWSEGLGGAAKGMMSMFGGGAGGMMGGMGSVKDMSYEEAESLYDKQQAARKTGRGV